MKPHESKKAGTKQEQKRRGKTKGNKKPNQKRRKDNKTPSQKEKRDGKKLDKKAIKRRNRRSKFWHMNCSCYEPSDQSSTEE
jgi:hypothetical protein